MTLNFGRFTKSISYMQSKMKSFAKVINLKPNVIMISIDLIDACFSVPLHLEHQKYLIFFLQIISIHLFVSGYGPALRIYTKLRYHFHICEAWV